ncbi:acetamidase/formamidase family protein [Sandarakinorhabdus sp.]|uniref:acetamidase/formamidase family protein n=1 Tax=Sandarakinorhabdus sp. TaxID=1916663 RepID=UPI00286DCD45|nr:acetamidase/formamidase family protein [Sandarakinorhabdus sp.]
MRILALWLCLASQTALAATENATWIVRTTMWGNNSYATLTLSDADGRLSGSLDGDKVDGEKAGDTVRFTVTDRSGNRSIFTAKATGDTMIGSTDAPDTNDRAARAIHGFSARRVPNRPNGPPRIVDFQPQDYSNSFDPHRTPVLTIWPGDTVRTTTVDSGGVDAAGKTRALYGNPQTGPFFVAGAQPGDTLVIRINRLKLSRDYADSLDMIVRRAQGTSLAPRATALGQPVRWTIDRNKGVTSPDTQGGRLRDIALPVRPMLGGLAVAPGYDAPPISAGDTGSFGGNMDFNEVVEGNSVLLPVQQPGALLYLGDAHALQGDGEMAQYGLETSMAVEFTVDLIKGKAINTPRVESPTQIMVLGQAGSLDEALRSATTGMVDWLAQDYGLTPSESAQLLGSVVKLEIANLAGRSVGVAAKLDKQILARIKPSKP